ncbi:hypothetical protein FPQ18DRAFT_307838 [Pyronema domesticum]|nr:hypothetical protein FPQ18DRAFT_307838 [Pyronema domesticum]
MESTGNKIVTKRKAASPVAPGPAPRRQTISYLRPKDSIEDNNNSLELVWDCPMEQCQYTAQHKPYIKQHLKKGKHCLEDPELSEIYSRTRQVPKAQEEEVHGIDSVEDNNNGPELVWDCPMEKCPHTAKLKLDIKRHLRQGKHSLEDPELSAIYSRTRQVPKAQEGEVRDDDDDQIKWACPIEVCRFKALDPEFIRTHLRGVKHKVKEPELTELWSRMRIVTVTDNGNEMEWACPMEGCPFTTGTRRHIRRHLRGVKHRVERPELKELYSRMRRVSVTGNVNQVEWACPIEGCLFTAKATAGNRRYIRYHLQGGKHKLKGPELTERLKSAIPVSRTRQEDGDDGSNWACPLGSCQYRITQLNRTEQWPKIWIHFRREHSIRTKPRNANRTRDDAAEGSHCNEGDDVDDEEENDSERSEGDEWESSEEDSGSECWDDDWESAEDEDSVAQRFLDEEEDEELSEALGIYGEVSE